jgi:hypothetical protein
MNTRGKHVFFQFAGDLAILMIYGTLPYKTPSQDGLHSTSVYSASYSAALPLDTTYTSPIVHCKNIPNKRSPEYTGESIRSKNGHI